MSALIELPEAQKLSSFFTSIFGANIVAGGSPQLDKSKSLVISTYVEGEAIEGLIVCELKIANFLGAALSLIPVGWAEDNTAENTVPDNIEENLREVMNICNSLFLTEKRLVFRDMIKPGDEISDEINAILDSDCNVTYEVEVPKYGTGNVAVFTRA